MIIDVKERITKRWKKLLQYKKNSPDEYDPLQDLSYRRPKDMCDLRPDDYRGVNINITSIWNKFKHRNKT